VKSVTGYVTEIWCERERDGYGKTKYMGQDNIENDISTRDRTRYMENKN
jgi:hypothetical protein